RANGLVERPHFDIRQVLYKACDGEQSKWHTVFQSVIWADRVTVRKHMGCSPYFAATGTHPILPLDIIKATYLLLPPEAVLDTTDLITRRAIALQKRRSQLQLVHSKVYQARVQAARRFELENAASITRRTFDKGDLVLM
ncbi:hypothetical protein BV22DRAFT_1025794, partial [Leucogyrophana mollusca]